MRHSRLLKTMALPTALCLMVPTLLTAAGSSAAPTPESQADTARAVAEVAATPPQTGPTGTGSDEAVEPGSDVRHVGPDYNAGKPVERNFSTVPSVRGQLPRRMLTSQADVGEVKLWLALDDALGQVYVKRYRLRGIGRHIQVWVAGNRKFPAGDCRNELGLTRITDRKIAMFIREFDTTIYPTESRAFSVPRPRAGLAGAALARELGLPADYWRVDARQADDIVVLVDNVRDPNFYEPRSPEGQTFIAGFFASFFNDLHGRNIMTIDAYDWRHRTGANPPDDEGLPEYRACTEELGASRPVGRPNPRGYEAVFAHEYQHLLHHYTDPDEVPWVNEGLSDHAETLVGYVDPAEPVTRRAADSHLRCFSGYLARQGFGGPENSLTIWGDQGGPEILCDYGAAFSFMQYLHGHYGPRALTRMHVEPRNGLRALRAVVGNVGRIPMRVVHRWAAMVALDRVLDQGAELRGGRRAAYSEDSLTYQIKWSAYYNDINHDGVFGDRGNEAYSRPGAPPNGSDYVRLRGRPGQRFLTARRLTSVSFRGSGIVPPEPVEWMVDPTPPSATAESLVCGPDGTPTGGPGTLDDPALYSGCGDLLDRGIVRRVAVPTGDPTLTFDALWDIEAGWDFAFVQVWHEEPGRFVSVPCTSTTRRHDPGALPQIVANLPGYTGDSGDWQQETCDLSAYAGSEIDLAFRYMTDPAVAEGGFWVDDITLGGQSISDGSSLEGWQSLTQAHPVPVFGFTVQLVAYRDDGSVAWVGRMPMRRTADSGFASRLGTSRLRAMIGRSADTVAAIVTQNDPTELVEDYVPYELRANGFRQPGGGRLN